MKFSTWLIGTLALTAAWGCGKGDGRYRAPTIPVNGQLLVDGKPFGPCVIFFAATEQDPDEKKWIPTVTGNVKDDGSFVLTTYAQGDGAPAGKYSVSLGPDAANLLAKVPNCQPVEVEIEEPDDPEGQEVIEVKLDSSGG
jgi:hypothetical protein